MLVDVSLETMSGSATSYTCRRVQPISLDLWCHVSSILLIILIHTCMSVVVRKLQVEILARSSRGISQTVRIDCFSILPAIVKTGPPRECPVDRQRPEQTAAT